MAGPFCKMPASVLVEACMLRLLFVVLAITEAGAFRRRWGQPAKSRLSGAMGPEKGQAASWFSVGRRTDHRWFVIGDGRTVNAEKGRQPGLNRLGRVETRRRPGVAVSGTSPK